MPSLTEIIAAIGRYLVYDPDAPLLFSSGTFWALFIVFMPLYGLLRNRVLQMSAFVVAFSLFFYYKCSGWFALLLVSTSLVDWLLSQAMATEGATRSFRRGCVVLSLLSSLSVLAYFKYANFFLWNFHAMLGGNFQPLDLVLPVGISFYTFQSVSYIIDVYKNKVQPARTWLEYAFFLSFFPALVAGPIVRADYFLPQIRQNRHASRNEVYTGLWLIILGVYKKAVIADYIAMYNDLIFDAPGAYTGFEALMGIVGYAMQIYCDFSGYSDMAIGLALIMGFRLALNFDFPYKARNISDFWHRWHISLSTWLRDYVYIPLGGNRKGKVRTYVNLMATMLIGGLWHGAAWKFVLWGGVHGAGLAAHKAAAPVLSKIPDNRLMHFTGWLSTMVFVVVLWVFFRADSASDALEIIGSASHGFSVEQLSAFAASRMLWLILMGVTIVSHFLPSDIRERSALWFVGLPWPAKLIIFMLTVQCVLEFRSSEVAPFIYFQF